VPHHEIGMAAGLLNLTRNLAGVFGVALFNILLNLKLSYMTLFLISSCLMLGGVAVASILKESSKDYI
jgi:hypothetical protein